MNSQVKKKNLVGSELEMQITRFRTTCSEIENGDLVSDCFDDVFCEILSLLNQHKYGVLYNIIRKNCF